MDAADHPGDPLVPFRSPDRFLGSLDPETAGRVIASAADIALVVEGGVIRDVALGNEELQQEGRDRAWRDKPWIETVTVESRPKIEDLLRSDRSSPIRWRQVNHVTAEGADLPIRYTAVPLGDGHRVVALGRDLRTIASVQQRLVEAHQEMERDYARLREAESRYRLLFQSISQPVLVVDPRTLEIQEVNPAAATTLGESVQQLVGSSIEEAFARKSQAGVTRLISEAMSLGSADATRVQLKSGAPCEIAASAFRQERDARVIVRLEPEGGAGTAAGGDVVGILQDLPDGLVVAGPDLRIVTANAAFVEMTHVVHRGQVVGRALSEFVGRSATELNVLTSNLKNHGVVRNFTTVLKDRFGNEEAVEISAVATPAETGTLYGLSVRNVARRLRTGPPLGQGLPASNEQLAGLVGRVPLKDIVRQSTDFIEKLCIEAALEVTGDNRASAAEMLGLSRQGLYSKLKRFGIDD